MSKKFEFLGNACRGLKRLVLGSDEMRLYRKTMLNYYVFDDDRSYEIQYDEAYAFYERLLIENGFDPVESPMDIDGAVAWSYNEQYRVFDEYVAAVAAQRAQWRDSGAPGPIPGSDAHMRQEAEKTFAATGVYGLPNSGGYVLTKADKERLGLLY